MPPTSFIRPTGPPAVIRVPSTYLGASAPPREPVGPDQPAPISTFLFDLALIPGTAFLWGSARQGRSPVVASATWPTGRIGESRALLLRRPAQQQDLPQRLPLSA